MGRDSRLRTITRRLKQEPPMKVVPSKKGLATTFAVFAVLGWGCGFGLNLVRHLFR